MKTNSRKTVMVCLVAAAVMALGANAYAAQGMMQSAPADKGYGGHGHDYHQGYGPYGFMRPELTPEQRQQLDAERQAYFKATEKTRTDLYAKRLELRAEMVRENPDVKKASDLQREISELRGNLDQKRLKHILAIRKIDPNAGRGFHRGAWGRGHHGFQGPGREYGPGMMGYGPGRGYGPGYGNGMMGYGPGRGYGPGMMGYGPGMMGYGHGRGYGPGYGNCPGYDRE
jgi:Spy/CpxP family protein refolding chaperone